MSRCTIFCLPTLLCTLAVLPSVLAAADGVPQPIPGAAGGSAVSRPKSAWSAEYAYGTAVAHAPNFTNVSVWPRMTGKEPFLSTTFSKGRSLVWARPGTWGGEKGIDPVDPANWIDSATGAPAAAAIDAETDLVLPAAGKRYVVDFQNPGHGRGDGSGIILTVRCITVGGNAVLNHPDLNLRGHLWVQRGGHFLADGDISFLGDQHTFARNDNDCVVPDASGTDKTYLSQYLVFNKDSLDASAEFIGHFHTSDEFQIFRGTFIVGADSVVEMGREASPHIDKDARIALMDNAYLGKWTNDLHCHDMDVRGGALQGGFPDRPLSRPAHLRIGFKNHSNEIFSGKATDDDGDPMEISSGLFQRVPGLILRSGSSLRSYTVDGDLAGLVISPLPSGYPVTFLRPIQGSPMSAEQANNRRELFDWIDRLPRGIDVVVASNVPVEGVSFEGLRKGGLMLENPDDRKGWKSSFRGLEAGAVEDLISPFPSGLQKGTQSEY